MTINGFSPRYNQLADFLNTVGKAPCVNVRAIIEEMIIELELDPKKVLVDNNAA